MSGSEWNFLKDIKSLLMTSWKKIRCIVFSIVKTDNDYMQNHLFELSATEIENFKLTGKIYHIHIKSRISYEKSDKINILLDDYEDDHYNQNTKQQLQNLIDFIGNDSFLITHIPSDCRFLMNELKYWNLQEIPKERFRCTFEIANKIFKKKGENHSNLLSLKDFCDYFEIEYPDEIYFNDNLYDCQMNAKLFIHLYESYKSIYEKKNDIKTKNIPEITQIQQIESKIGKKNENKFDSLIENMNKINLHTKEKALAFIAVSSKNNEKFSYAGRIHYSNKCIIMKGKVDDDYNKMGSPGAVMFACRTVINSLIESGEISEIYIYSSYTGIKNFTSNKWTPDKKKISDKWLEDINKYSSSVIINFVTVNRTNSEIVKAKNEAENVLK